MSILQTLFSRSKAEPPLAPLYAAIVAAAREPGWYREGGVPDTLDGRFDMVAAILALVLIRFEAEGEAGAEPAARLTELFITDMDGQLRQQGIGDIVIGKHVGRMVGALGGRLTAYRSGLRDEEPLADALARNLYRGAPTSADAINVAELRLRAFSDRLGALPIEAVLAGKIAA